MFDRILNVPLVMIVNTRKLRHTFFIGVILLSLFLERNFIVPFLLSPWI